MTDRALVVERMDEVAVVRLNRAPMNALDLELVSELEVVLGELDGDPDVSALILTGTGTCFSGGLDLKRVPFYGPEQQAALVTALNRAIGRLYALPVPTMAAVNGHALAGGLVLALACDYRVGVEGEYRLGLTEARVGIPFLVAALAVVQAELGRDVARRLVLSAATSGPEEALAWGVLDELEPGARFRPRALERARELAARPRRSYARIKRRLRAAPLACIQEALENGGDPLLLSGWLIPETVPASAGALAARQRTP